jgi:hypothetical protein
MPHCDAAPPVCIGGLLRFFDDFRREWIEVPVAVNLAAAITKLDDRMARRERLHKQKAKTFTDIELEGNHLVAGKPARGPKEPCYPGRPWEGPAFSFTLLVGVGTLWFGPPRDGEPCVCCAGIELERHAVCILCCRSGRDREIPRPTPRELAALRERVPKRDGLPGGVGKAPLATKLKVKIPTQAIRRK